MGKFSEENQAKFKQLERDRDRLQTVALLTGLTNIFGLTIYALSLLALYPSYWLALGKLQTTSQRYFLMPELMAAFEQEDILIEVGLKPSGVKGIDFFLRFPDKEYVLIQIGSLTSCKVVYNEKLEALQYRKYRKKGGALKTWKPDPLLELVAQEQWIRKESGLLGTTSNDKRRPIAKLLVLWTDTALGDLSEVLYDRLNESKYATIRRRSTFNIVPKDQVLDFIKDYLAFRRSSKNPQNN